jgi:uncharacterized membrane protein YeaQ/YmgE (transglycosylase-associated protein family)
VGILAFLIAIFVWGLIVGALARLAVPGPDPMSIWRTSLLGIAGAVVGGLVGRLLGVVPGFLFALLGAVLLLVLYRRFVEKRPLTGPRSRFPARARRGP